MFKKLRESLNKTRQSVFGQLAATLTTSDITEETWEELEALLIQSDMGVQTTIYLIDTLRERAEQRRILRADQLIPLMREVMREILIDAPTFQTEQLRALTVVLVVGVNGSGKTTSIGKMARYYQDRGRKVMLVAADTFRAAAIDQLKIWGERVGAPVIAGEPNGDPAAMIYDGIRAARARGYDMLIIDTAGRLHTKFNLMKELEKVFSVCEKSVHLAPHEVILVVDAPTGQNALLQAQKFQESVKVTGVILTKLDGTAKGGMVFSIYRDLKLPIRFVGTGEKIDDFTPFDADTFVDGLFDKGEKYKD